MARPSLLIISFSEIVSDARVLKQVRLFTPDYDVTTCSYGAAPDGVVDHVAIPAGLVYWAYPKPEVVARRFGAAYRKNPVVAYLWDRLPRDHFDVILADDVDTVPLARHIGARKGIHADLHEYAPRMKEELTRWRLFVAPLMRWICREHVARVESVTTVAEGIAREYEKEFGFRPTVVTNASPYADLGPTPVGDPIRLVHAGAARADRYLELMIDAVDLVRLPVTLDFFLTTNDPAYLDRLREHASRVPGVRVHPALPYARLIGELNTHDVGIYILPPVNFNNEWALPNKLFDFVQARLGLVFGPSPEMAAIIRRYGIGLVTEEFTATSLAASIEQLTPDLVARFKQASDDCALALSAQSQVKEWARSIARLAAE